MAGLKCSLLFLRTCLGLQLGFCVFRLRYLFSAAYVASQIFTLVLIFWTFAELAQPDVETAGPNRFKGPLPREGRILPLSEPVSLIFRLGCFFLHPLRIAAQSEKGEAAKAVTAKTEEV